MTYVFDLFRILLNYVILVGRFIVTTPCVLLSVGLRCMFVLRFWRDGNM